MHLVNKKEKKNNSYFLNMSVNSHPINPSLVGTFWFVVVSWGTHLSIVAPHCAARKITFDFLIEKILLCLDCNAKKSHVEMLMLLITISLL